MNPKRCVVLDTNGYRRLGRGRTPEQARKKGAGIRARDEGQQVQAVAHPLVIVELLAHLGDPGDPARNDCHAAIVALWEHCGTTLLGARQLAILEDPETQLAVALYGICPIGNHRLVENLALTTRLIGETDQDDILSRLHDTLVSAQETVDSIEQRFVEDMMRFVVQGFDPQAATWDALKTNSALRQKVSEYLEGDDSARQLARAKVRLARTVVDRDAAQPIGVAEVERVLEAFNCHLQLYRRIVRKIVMTGCDVSKKKHRNWIWDLQIAFALGGYTVRGGLTTDLVTGDTDVVEAARAAGFGDRVLTFDEYSARLRGA